MITSTSEDSSEDEDTNVFETAGKIDSHELEEKIPGGGFRPLSQAQAKNLNSFYYSNDDSVEDAQTFNKNMPLNCSDPFLKNLGVILKKFPSINVKATIKTKQSERPTRLKNQELVPPKEQCNKDKDGPSTLRAKKTNDGSKFKSRNDSLDSRATFPSPFSNELDKDMSNTDMDESCISEYSKNKGKHLIKTLNSFNGPSFSSFFLDHKKEFLELLPVIDAIQDVIPQTIEVILKIFSMEHALRQNMLCALTQDEFVGKIVTYITLLPTDCEENTSDSDIEQLFTDILLFCENINDTMPLKSGGILRKILLSLQYAARGLKEVRNWDLDETVRTKISKLLENSSSQPLRGPKRKKNQDDENGMEPPDSVKDIDIFPTKKDLFEPATFLRKNVVDGAYRDVNHYIDVQFRLLREDFIAPLRIGLQLYCESIAKGHQLQNQRFDNIRIHGDVKILHGTITNGRLGHLIQLRTDVGFHRDSKRFMFGSLVLFTADNFDTFFCGTVINPSGENLLIVELCGDDSSLSDIYSKIYTMIESEVYFGPYFHVLTALQEFDCERFPMKEYIVEVKPNNKESHAPIRSKCPTGLNESQKEAFKSAMANEFVVIQGPPGTGKTFLAEKITKTILLNKGPIKVSYKTLIGVYGEEERASFRELKWRLRKNRRSNCVYVTYPEEWKLFHNFFRELERDDKPILVVCYTNHALDQFLERLTGCTKRVIRVGGQSKNTAMQQFNIKEIRRCWIKEQTFNCRRCNCYLCSVKARQYDSYIKHVDEVQYFIYCYLVSIKILEAIELDGIVRIVYLYPYMSQRLRSALGIPLGFQDEQYKAWLLEGADTFHIEDKDINEEDKPEFTVHTNQLLSELRESSTYWDELEMYDVSTTVESESTAEAGKKFVVKVSELSQCKDIQKKLRKCRKKGGNENMIDLYENQVEDLEKQRRYVSYMLAHKPPVDLKRIRELNRTSNIWTIEFEDRWMLYNYWVQQYKQEINRSMFTLERSLKEEERRFNKIRDEFDLSLLKSANVIGMTTTGAARLRNMLEEVGPEIVVVEEAAEVLEAHVVVTLNPSVKKVILIGDHKQLKPNPAVYELAKQYRLDVSLFERMINNGLACQVLDTQQRMRPEIASLIVPGIYPDLKNGERVLDRPDIRGVAANVFFVTHNKFENEAFGETRSHSNSHEVDFLISLCQYLLQQDYPPSAITILATYLGQMTALENERRRKNLPTDLRITTVDNYQGEESDIILLSLVRSNAEARIGFLFAENRVCVALSRAKNGLYIIGNMDNLTQSSSVWRQVKAQLEAMNAIGSALPLGCKTHQSGKSTVSCSNDFKQVPVSGCKMKCGVKLKCGHVCLEFCHSYDSEHEEKFACSLPCERMACEKHRCPKTCGKVCGSCKVLVEKQLACGHFVQLQCWEDPKYHSCKENVTLTSEICGHTVTKLCCEKRVSCVVPCTDTMDCGHPCKKPCHAHYKVLPEYRLIMTTAGLRSIRQRKPEEILLVAKDSVHNKRFCSEEVEVALECGHTCKIYCDNSEGKIACIEPCPETLPCEHPCTKLCGEPCTTRCDTLVEKTLSLCGHQLMLPCNVAAESSQCRQPCQLSLPCGHPCQGTCSADCGQFSCQEKVRCSVEPACGHALITIPCYANTTDLESNSDQLLQHCRAPCRADLPCGHLCAGRCGPCLQGRLHMPCSYPCTRILNCGHRCERQCCSECPAVCGRPCMYRCPHQACDQLCGDPCTPCQKVCKRSCKHQQCSRVCSEDCDCPPCDEPCPSILRCGHRCPGFCGESCPKHCTDCCPDGSVVHGQTLYPGVDRYVSLDCGHQVEDNLLRKLMIADTKPKKCPVCDEPIRFVLRFKDHIKQYYAQLASAKAEENVKVANFESKMKTDKYNLNYYSSYHSIETYGDHAFFILEHLKKAPLVYQSSMWIFTFFKQLTKSDRHNLKEDKSWDTVLERRKLLLAALSLRLKSMSSSDYLQFLTEIFRLELATKNWPVRSHLLLSLKKYSLDELKALE